MSSSKSDSNSEYDGRSKLRKISRSSGLKKNDKRNISNKGKSPVRKPTDVLKYYKDFSKKPSEFKSKYKQESEQEESDSSVESDSSCSDSSSDDFPSPKTPVKNKNTNYENILKDMQKRLHSLEVNQKRR